MTITVEEIEMLREIAQSLERAHHRSGFARQRYIATRSEADRRNWDHALTEEHDAWLTYWAAHQQYFTGKRKNSAVETPPGRPDARAPRSKP